MSKHQGPPPGYVEVSERIAEFREQFPDGSLQAEIVELRDDLVIVKAYAYRTADDPRPGTGLASEPIPGKTNFTRDSELMNAETSAWGRALIAVGAADAKRGIASANEVRNRQSDVPPAKKSAPKPTSEPTSPKRLLMDRLKQEGVDPQTFVDWLQSTYGVQRLDDLEDADRIKVVDGVTKGGLCDQLKEVA